MHRSLRIAAAAAIFAILSLAGQAKATVLILSGPLYSANLTWNNDGAVSLKTAPAVDYTGILQQNELFTNFTSGSTLPAGSNIDLSYATSGGLFHHTISFSNAFGALGDAYTWGFEIFEQVAGRFQLSTKASLLQALGFAGLGFAGYRNSRTQVPFAG